MKDCNDEEQQYEVETESQETDKDIVSFATFTSRNGWVDYQIDNFSVMAISVAFTAHLSEDDLNGHIVE